MLVLVALNVDGDIPADSLAVTHLTEDASVGAEYALDREAGTVRVEAYIHRRVAVEIHVLGRDLSVRGELSDKSLVGVEASTPASHGDFTDAILVRTIIDW